MPRPSAMPAPISIVTPSLNQGRFIRETIDSVLAQDGGLIEYLVVDGGSTDGTLDILRSYGNSLRWISEPDRGQSDAIAKGFALTHGEILGWLCADDRLVPGSGQKIHEAFARAADASLVYGEGVLLDDAGGTTGLSWTEPFNLSRLVHVTDYILQPAAFFRRSAYNKVGGLDGSLTYGMDWDLWIRLANVGSVVHLPDVLAQARLWAGTKTANGGWRRIAELSTIAKRHSGRRLTPAIEREALRYLGTAVRRHLPLALGRPAAALGRWLDSRIVSAQNRRWPPPAI